MGAHFALAAVAVLVVVLVLVIILVVVLITVLVIHSYFLQIFLTDESATVVYPKTYALSFALKRKLAINPALIAAVIPPADAFSPPVKIPRKPS